MRVVEKDVIKKKLNIRVRNKFKISHFIIIENDQLVKSIYNHRILLLKENES